MLVDANKRDLSVELFGVKYSSPVLIGPVGVLSLFVSDEIADYPQFPDTDSLEQHEDGEIAVARAAAKIKSVPR